MSSEKKIEDIEARIKHLERLVAPNQVPLINIDKQIKNLNTTKKKHEVEIKRLNNMIDELRRKLKGVTNSNRQADLEQRSQHKYNELQDKINNYIKRVHHLESAQQEQVKQAWANEDVIDDLVNRKLEENYSKVQIEKGITELVEGVKLDILQDHKVKLDESLARLKKDLQQEITAMDIAPAGEYGGLSEALESHMVQYQSDLAEFRNDIKFAIQLRQLFEESQKEHTDWQEEQQNITEEIRQQIVLIRSEVNRVNDVELQLKIESDRVDSLELTLETISEQLSDLQKDRGSLKAERVQGISDEKSIKQSVISDVFTSGIRSLIKEELTMFKAAWLKEVQDYRDFSQNTYDHFLTTSKEVLKEEIERYLLEDIVLNKALGISREDLDAAIKLPLSQIDSVKQVIEERISDFNEQIKSFDVNIDDLYDRLETLNKKIDDHGNNTIDKPTTPTSAVMSKGDPPREVTKKPWEHLIYFTPQPNIDDVFIHAKVSTSFKPGKTIYQIKLASQEATEGELHLVSDTKTLQMAHNAPDTYLTACEFQAIDINQLNPSSTRPGKVIWNGKNWKLVERIIVR